MSGEVKIVNEGLMWVAYRSGQATPMYSNSRKQSVIEHVESRGLSWEIRDYATDIGDEDAFVFDPDLGGGF